MGDYPKCIVDGRKDRSRYPRMICAGVERPQVLQNSVDVAQAKARIPIDPPSKEQLSVFEKQRSELPQVALEDETMAMAFATIRNDIGQVVDRFAAMWNVWVNNLL